jgi:electron transfer flavoprotein alpha subunit
MKTLIITLCDRNTVSVNFSHVLTAAKQIGDSIEVVVIGSATKDAVAMLTQFQALSKVLVLESARLASPLAEDLAPVLSALIKDNYTHVLVAADSFGKNLLPRIAGVLEVSQISDVVAIHAPNRFSRFMYAGNVLVEVESLANLKLLTIRTTNFVADEELSNVDIQANVVVEKLQYEDAPTTKVRILSEDVGAPKVDLTNANVVVSGGRSLGSKDAFDELIGGLAGKLNAGVGATRAAVEDGFAPNDAQVGQTGKVVAPKVYLAFGVSGAMQHIAGMKDSKIVIAVNTDSTAPIFEYADYGMVADLFKVIPELIEKI